MGPVILPHDVQYAANKYHLTLFDIFQATTWNFLVKFYTFITCSYTQKCQAAFDCLQLLQSYRIFCATT